MTAPGGAFSRQLAGKCRKVGGGVAATFLALPLPVPLPSPAPGLVPAVHIPSLSVPVISTPPLPTIGPTPGSQAQPTAAPAQGTNAGGAGRPAQPPSAPGGRARESARARGDETALSVALIDIDGLKAANDRRGHAAGDRMLRVLSQALKDGLRAEDVVFRYGGDEFVCVLPDTAAREARIKLGEIQDAAAKAGVRFCAGVAELRRPDDVVSLFARADKDLYDFKAERGEIVQLPSKGKKAGGERTVTA